MRSRTITRRALAAAALGAVLGAGCAGPERLAPIEDQAGGPGAASGATTGPIASARSVPRPRAAPPAPTTARAQRPALPPAAGTDPAVAALVASADAHAAAGRHDLAAAALERALRIAPSDPWLWHRLARERFAQGDLGQAAGLAARSNALPTADARLRARNWALIADVHERRGERVAARHAREESARLGGG